MLLAFTSGGRLGNQLMYASNMMASAIQYGIPYKNISFAAEQYFESNGQEYGAINKYNPKLCWALTKYMYSSKRLLKSSPGILSVIDNSDLAVEMFKQSNTSRGGVKLFHCWPYLDFYSLYNQQNIIRELIKPKNQFIKDANQYIQINRGKDLTVAVHVRKADYKNWMNGKYYFDNDVYKARMTEMVQLFDSNEIRFLVFGDNSIDMQALKSNCYDLRVSNNSPIVDMIAMSYCDYIIGPPSTFSGYASFMGKTPKFIMVNKDESIVSKSQFGIYMIDIMDHILNEYGDKIITKIERGHVICQ